MNPDSMFVQSQYRSTNLELNLWGFVRQSYYDGHRVSRIALIIDVETQGFASNTHRMGAIAR